MNKLILHIIIFSIIFLCLNITKSFANQNLNWFTSAGSYKSERFFQSSGINKFNINELEKLWIFNSGSTDKFDTVQSAPIFIDGQLIFVTLSAELISVSPISGKIIWKKKLNSPLGRRGLTFYESKSIKHSGIYIASGNKILQIDLKGNILSEFSSGLSLLQPIIHEDILYVATLRNGVKSFDLNTKEQIWHRPLSKNGVSPRVWSGFSFDEDTKTVFIVTSNPGGVIGENRSGDDFSVSLIAISGENGQIKWHYKHIKNDVWDFDLISNPLIIKNLELENKNFIDVVIALTKTGDIIMVNLLNGLPVFENSFKELNVEKSKLKNVKLSETQKYYLKPDKFSNIVVDKDNDFNHLNEENLLYVETKLRNSRMGFYIPPSLDYDVVTYGLHGGAEWPGGTIFRNKKKINLIIPSNHNPWIIRVNYQDKKYLNLLESLNNENLNKFYTFLISIKNFVKFDKYSKETKNTDTPLSEQKVTSNFVDTSFKNRSEPNSFKPPDSKKYKIANFLYKYMPGSYKNSIYSNNCSSCHGNARQGRLDTEDKGDLYYPSLVGITMKEKFNKIDNFSKLKKIHEINNINLNINKTEYEKIIRSFEEHDAKLFDKKLLKKEGSWQALLDRNGMPATKPPWGKITNIDLKNGKKLWDIPFGTRKAKNGSIIKGDINFGGVMSTQNGILFATGTTEPYAYAFDIENGEILWKKKLPYSGSAQPMAFNYKGCDVVIFTSTGGRFVGYKKNGDSTVAFKLKNCTFE